MCFAKEINDYYNQMTTDNVLEITKVFLVKGAKIDFDIKENLDKYLEKHKDPLLKKLIEDNYSYCLIFIGKSC